MPECDNCGGHVTTDFHRVFASNSGVLHGCPECMDTTEIVNGKATRA